VVGDKTCGGPCLATQMNNRYTAYTAVNIAEIPHQGELVQVCPPELSGTLHFSCLGMERTLLGDRGCGTRCEAKNIIGYGYSFVTPRMEHLSNFSQPCNLPYTGTVQLVCADGEMGMHPVCRGGCFAGASLIPGGTKIALVPYPDLEDSVRFPTTCPEGFTGEVVLMCWNGTVLQDEGSCHAACPSGQWESKGVAITHYDLFHGEDTHRECPHGWSGNVTLQCGSGTVFLADGGCFEQCLAGFRYISEGVVIPYDTSPHAYIYPVRLCPAGYYGSIRLKCNDSKIDIIEGSCYSHCDIPSRYQRLGNATGQLLHGMNATLSCPALGTIFVDCFDGTMRELGGHCIEHCTTAGSLNDANSTTVEFLPMTHGSISSGTCVGDAIGNRTLSCNNSVVAFTNAPGDRCFRHCQSNEVVLRNPDPWAPKLKVTVATMLEHGQQIDQKCPEGQLGIVTLSCYDSLLSHDLGVCGSSNCRAGNLQSGSAVLEHGPINDGYEDGPFDCPIGFEGETTFRCSNGTVRVGEISMFASITDYTADRDLNHSNVSANSTASSTASEEELGEDPYSSRVLLCECCLAPVDPPATEPVAARNQWSRVYWGVFVVMMGVFVASIGGLVFVAKRLMARKPKLSRVAHTPDSEYLASVEADAKHDEINRKKLHWRTAFHGEDNSMTVPAS